jgi:hypothetical protein
MIAKHSTSRRSGGDVFHAADFVRLLYRERRKVIPSVTPGTIEMTAFQKQLVGGSLFLCRLKALEMNFQLHIYM